jgi:glucosamine-phosphate N-acetyltransferase
MECFLYDSLTNICEKHEEKIEDIRFQYMKLLSFLTNAPDISIKDFLDRVNQISKIGDIIVCYYEDLENNKIKILGSGTIIYEPKLIHGCKNVGHIEDIVVHDSYRSIGIAKNILNILVDFSNKNNCYKVILDCKEDLVVFYEKNGFKHNGNQMSKYF